MNNSSKLIYAVTGYANTTANGVGASSTNNNTGIFDLSGCVWEYTAGYISNGKDSLNTYGKSYANTSINANGYLTLSTKYAIVYPYNSSSDSTTNNYISYSEKKSTTYGFGDAVLETSTSGANSTGWNGDYSGFPDAAGPFFVYGGRWDSTSVAGIYAFSRSNGPAWYDDGFRSVLVTQ